MVERRVRYADCVSVVAAVPVAGSAAVPVDEVADVEAAELVAPVAVPDEELDVESRD